MYCKKYFCTLPKLTMYTPSLCCAWLVRYLFLVLISLVPTLGLHKGPRYLTHHESVGESPWGIGAVVTSVGSFLFWHPFRGHNETGKRFLCLFYTVGSSLSRCSTQTYPDISSMVRSPPGDGCYKKGDGSEWPMLPSRKHCSPHTPKLFPSLQGTQCHLFNQLNFLFFLF